ncbi:NADH-quinone oxidoreductase subunit C [Streptomyces sp. NPDC059917]|uniref:NADH-quinone oxidoreductase subunit C n=1 Tax=Streptomyces sp. NPDC059917 TaxID=3347002 RepID=UPI003668A434
MNLYETLPEGAPQVFGEEALGSYAYDVLTVDVPVGSWISALEIARDKLGCTYFDWLSAVDEPGTGFRICAHVVALENHRVRRLLLRTTVPHAVASLPSAVAVYAGAAWHERETFEMFGVTFTDHPNLVPLLLPENFEGHPLRKDFVLAARVAKAWPGAKEPGEGADPDGPKRRQMLPPGVPDPNEWGPLKGQLPPAPTRPARTPRAAGAAREGAPVRRARSVTDGSASQATPESAESAAPPRPARRTRSVTDGSASQATPEPAESAAPPRPARRTRSVTDGSASQATPEGTPASPTPDAPAAPRSSDAPWHDPKPAFTPAPPAPTPPAAAPTPAEPTPAVAPTPAPVAPEPTPAAPAATPAAPEPVREAAPESDPAAPAGGGPAEPAEAAPTPAPDPTEPSAGGPA